jgi:hypothetical protein
VTLILLVLKNNHLNALNNNIFGNNAKILKGRNMKNLITLTLLVASLNSMASAELQLKNCTQKAITTAGLEINRAEKTQDVLKSMNSAIKTCRENVKSQLQAEKKAKQKKSLLDKLAKMQEKLKSLN